MRFKCGDWSPSTGLNFTFYDEVYKEEASTNRKSPLRVVTLVVSITCLRLRHTQFS